MTGSTFGVGPRAGVKVSVVLPAHDELESIERTVERTRGALRSFLPPGSFEVIVAETGGAGPEADGTDRTPDEAARLVTETEEVRHVHEDERLGRGELLTRAFGDAQGSTLVYLDTDIAADSNSDHLETLIERVRSGACDVAIGSRWTPGAGDEADRPAGRTLTSRGVDLAARGLLGSSVHDHQCGFKAFSREAFESISAAVEADDRFWDTEVLVAAQGRGFEVCEFPVDWTSGRDSAVDPVRDVLGMGRHLLRCWWDRSLASLVTGRSGALLGILVSFALLVSLFLSFDPGTVLGHLRDADVGLIGLAALVYASSWPVRGLRYRSILATLGYPVGVGLATGAIFVSQTANLVFPARAGDAVRAYLMKARRGVSYPSGAASLVVERVFDLLTLTVLAGVVLVGLVVLVPGALVDALDAGLVGLSPGQRSSARTAVPAAAGVGGLAVLTMLVFVVTGRMDRNLVRRSVGWLSNDAYADRIASVVERFVVDVHRVSGSKRAVVRVTATSLAIWSLDVVTALLVLLAFDAPIQLSMLLVAGFLAVSAGNLAKVLPLSPSGIGLYEAVFTLVVVGLTATSAPLAFGVAIVDHALKNVVTAAGGALSAVGLNVSLSGVIGRRPSDGYLGDGVEEPRTSGRVPFDRGGD